ncbi:MAG TPA: IPT/TIG domain-containing protein, partial [Urbifossiella sp.]|nr:IPT/TIG domain-containing protein [Urbifossiella sp.]
MAFQSHVRPGRAARRAAFELLRLEERDVPALLGDTLFPADNPWNQQVTNAPVAANSSAVMSAIIAAAGNNRIHPDFGEDDRSAGAALYGIPYNVVHGNSVPHVNVVIDGYPDESDLLAAPIPANAVIEGDFQTGPNPSVDDRGDSHLIVFDQDNNRAYEFFGASRPGENTDGKWHADQESVWDTSGNSFRPLTWTSADAAGLAILPGLVRPDEALPVSQGGQGVIDHAIRFTLTNSAILNQFIYPASHAANPRNNDPTTEPPMGARFRLKANVDLSGLDPESRIIAQAMKDYGLVLADNGSDFYFSGASYSVDANNNFDLTYNDDDIQDTTHGLKSLHYSDFELVDLTPQVTGLSSSSGAAGDTLTVTGQNFGGAAGHLSVAFGNTPATNVAIVDDAHLRVGVPAGTGTVNLTVTSGVAAPGVSENVMNPIFGYGTSAVTRADQFTYGAALPPGNTPPTISNVTDRTIPFDGSSGPVPFTVGDAETPAASLNVSAAASVPSLGVTLGGSGANRTITVTPA